MTMKLVVLFAVLAMTIVVSAQRDDPDPEHPYSLGLLYPRGISLSRPGPPPGSPPLIGVQFVTGSINSTKGDDTEIDYGLFSQQDDGSWVYNNTNVTLSPGDTLFCTIGEDTTEHSTMFDLEFPGPFDARRVPT